jgi:hypothetical protein
MSKRVVALLVSVCFLAVAIPTGIGAVATGSQPPKVSKKWCKNHKKKCRKLYRANASNGGHVTVGKGWSKGTVKKPVEGVDPGLPEPSFGRASIDPDFWKADGGKPSKKGCQWITGSSQANSTGPPHFQLYQVSVRKHWCWKWKQRKVYNVSSDTFINDTALGVSKRDDAGGQAFYQWCCDKPRSGHWTARYWDLGAWCAVWVIGECFHHYYPYVRIYVHADGTFHMSGHDA